MKIKILSLAAIFTSLTGVAFAGQVQPAPVDVNFDSSTAAGDMVTARTDKNDDVFIGCGTRLVDNGVNPPFYFGFCQAEDSDGDSVVCFTQNANLLDVIKATGDYSFVTFSWVEVGENDYECTRIGFSTQSFYLPKNVAPNK